MTASNFNVSNTWELFVGIGLSAPPPATTPPDGLVYIKTAPWDLSSYTTPASLSLVNGIPTAAGFVNALPPSSSDWGRLAVLVDNVDVSFFRDIAVSVDKLTYAEPFSDMDAQLTFYQVTPFDEIGVGDLSFINPWSNIDIHVIYPSGDRDILWEGMVESLEFVTDETHGALVVTAFGALHQIQLYVRSPDTDDSLVDIGQEILGQWEASRGALRTALGVPIGTGLNTRYRGAWETVDQFISQMLDKYGVTDTANTQWCVYMDHPRTPVMRVKDRTTVNWTVWAGARGVAIDVTRSLLTETNVLYGQGTDTSGAQWSNQFPSSSVDVFYEPIAYDPTVHPIDVGTDGNLEPPDDGRLTPGKIRLESFSSFGQNVDFSVGQASAQQLYARAQQSNWAGTITLMVDPAEGSRMMIRDGHNIKVHNFQGQDFLFHIAQVEIDIGQNDVVTVQLTVDTKARDLPTLAAIAQKNRDVMRSPLYPLNGQTDSNLKFAKSTLWDSSQGSGTFPNMPAFDGTGRTDTGCTLTTGSSTITDPAITNDDQGLYVSGAGLPPNTYVGTVTGTTFQAVNSDGTPVNVGVSPGTTIQIGGGANYYGTGFLSGGGKRFVDGTSIIGCPASDGSTPGSGWTVFKFLCSERDNITMVKCFSTGPAVPFHFSIYNYPPDPIADLPSDPFAGTSISTVWEQSPPPNLLIGWGAFNDPAGFYPGDYNDTSSVLTGVMQDSAGFSYDHDNVAFASLDPGDVSGLKETHNPYLFGAIYVPPPGYFPAVQGIPASYGGTNVYGYLKRGPWNPT